MIRRFAFRPGAREDLREAARLYEKQAIGMGIEFTAEVRTAVVHLLYNPEAASPFTAGMRRKLLTRFPYGIIYHYENDLVDIVAVAHNRRGPQYWIDRLE